MAPTRPHNRNTKAKAHRLKKRAAAAAEKKKKNARQLLAEATASLEQGDAAGAAKAASRALEAMGEDGSGSGSRHSAQLSAALSLLGEIQLELGLPDAARGFFLRAVEADGAADDGGEGAEGDVGEEESLLLHQSPGGTGANRAEKYLWLAQLSEEGGADSVGWYEKGAGILRGQISRLEGKCAAAVRDAATITTATTATDDNSSTTSSSIASTTSTAGTAGTPTTTPAQRRAAELEDSLCDLRRRLASALCAVAEVYMTDLSWETDAEARCEALVTEATLLAPDFPDAWQTVANVRISQGRVAEARAALERALGCWWVGGDGDDDEGEGERVDDGDGGGREKEKEVPPFPTRVSLVRLLMEVEWEDKAVAVAERLAREDDQSIEVLYLGGFGLYVMGEKLKKKAEEAKNGDGKGGDAEEWRTPWASSRRWLKRCLELFAEQDYEDERLGEHAQELLGLLKAAIGEGEGNDDDDDRWEDAEEEEEEEEEGEDGDEDAEMEG